MLSPLAGATRFVANHSGDWTCRLQVRRLTCLTFSRTNCHLPRPATTPSARCRARHACQSPHHALPPTPMHAMPCHHPPWAKSRAKPQPNSRTLAMTLGLTSSHPRPAIFLGFQSDPKPKKHLLSDPRTSPDVEINSNKPPEHPSRRRLPQLRQVT